MAQAGGYWQHTLARSIRLKGVGVHGGIKAAISIFPADVDSGIVFMRGDLPAAARSTIPARHDLTVTTELATVIGGADGAAVSTIEHVMAALYGLGVDNALVVVNGPEVPILDGSARPYVEAISSVGLERQEAVRRFLRVRRKVRVENGAQFGELLPYDGFGLDVEIIYPDAEIGRQRVVIDSLADGFARELADARTFGFYRDVERLRAAGFALGASLENTIVIGEGKVLNEEGVRFSDEFVRHKALDAVGDLALIGRPLLGFYRSSRGGHKLNAQVVAALLADSANYDIVELADGAVRQFPCRTAPAMARAVGQAAFAPERR